MSQRKKEKGSWKRSQGKQVEDEKNQIQEKKELEKETDQIKSRQLYFLFS